jgi:hypothetical protein
MPLCNQAVLKEGHAVEQTASFWSGESDWILLPIDLVSIPPFQGSTYPTYIPLERREYPSYILVYTFKGHLYG